MNIDSLVQVQLPFSFFNLSTLSFNLALADLTARTDVFQTGEF